MELHTFGIDIESNAFVERSVAWCTEGNQVLLGIIAGLTT
jgi:hypothetical protein